MNLSNCFISPIKQLICKLVWSVCSCFFSKPCAHWFNDLIRASLSACITTHWIGHFWLKISQICVKWSWLLECVDNLTDCAQKVSYSRAESESELALLPGMFSHTRKLFWWQKLHSATEWQRQDRTQIIKKLCTNIQNWQCAK